MSSREDKRILRVGVCSHEAAKHACERWHYSACLPAGRLIRIGAEERGEYIGCVLFGRGAAPYASQAFNLQQIEFCELVRLALRADHINPVSRVLALSLRLLKQTNPGLRLVSSYADPGQGHHGGIYQATGWIYIGTSSPNKGKMMFGKEFHKRSVNSTIGPNTLPYAPVSVKHKYLYPLDEAMRAQCLPLAKPYPKRDSDATG